MRKSLTPLFSCIEKENILICTICIIKDIDRQNANLKKKESIHLRFPALIFSIINFSNRWQWKSNCASIWWTRLEESSERHLWGELARGWMNRGRVIEAGGSLFRYYAGADWRRKAIVIGSKIGSTARESLKNPTGCLLPATKHRSS